MNRPRGLFVWTPRIREALGAILGLINDLDAHLTGPTVAANEALCDVVKGQLDGQFAVRLAATTPSWPERVLCCFSATMFEDRRFTS